MSSILDWATGQIAKELNISPALSQLIYKSYWKFIRSSISDLELDNITEGDFKKLTTNFNIPYIGKLYTSYDKIQKYNRRIKYLENVKVKRDKTDVQSGSGD